MSFTLLPPSEKHATPHKHLSHRDNVIDRLEICPEAPHIVSIGCEASVNDIQSNVLSRN